MLHKSFTKGFMAVAILFSSLMFAASCGGNGTKNTQKAKFEKKDGAWIAK
jgi:hypothetical protein